MGLQSVPIPEALTHADTLEVSIGHSLIRVLLPALEHRKANDIQAIEAVQRTFSYKIT